MLAPRTFIDPTPKPRPKKRKWLRRVTPARSKQLREYSERRKIFLASHAICQIWLDRNGWAEADMITTDEPWYYFRAQPAVCYRASDLAVEFFAPRSTEVHHKDRRHGERLNREEDWMALCAKNHAWIKENQSAARAKGWLV